MRRSSSSCALLPPVWDPLFSNILRRSLTLGDLIESSSALPAPAPESAGGAGVDPPPPLSADAVAVFFSALGGGEETVFLGEML